MAYVYYNPNPGGLNAGDCTVRAIAAATGQSWEKTYTDLALHGFVLHDMPSANRVWGAYLRQLGFRRAILPEDALDGYTVAEFAHDHPYGTYILALSGHVVCVVDGDYLDTWDSGGEIPIYYWSREGW